MRCALVSFLAICNFSGTGYSQERVRPAIERIVPLLERAAAGSADQRECFTCHSQGLPILALTEARQHGFKVDEANWQRQLDHTYAHLHRNHEKYAKGEGTGGKADTAGSALWALAAGDRVADETTAAVVEFLLSWQSTDDHWSCTSDRPPSEASDFTTTYLSLRGITEYGTDTQLDRITARRESARNWLVNTAPEDTEDRVFRMWALQLAGAEANVVASAASDLLSRQRPDGGWSQLEDQESDAYATATALVALHRTESIGVGDAAYQRGVDYLLGEQLDDGSWHVVSRSVPFQTYYESGFPHGVDQFISTTASAWATLALLAAAPQEPAQPTAPPVSERKSQSSALSAIETNGEEITDDERTPARPAGSHSLRQ